MRGISNYRASAVLAMILGAAFATLAKAQQGACCGFSGSCNQTTLGNCIAGFFHSGETCAAACPVRACCAFFGGGCSLTWSCNGIAHAGTCSPSPCTPPTTGACCVGGACNVTALIGCVSGVWNPNQTCAQVTCAQPGACCNLFTNACTSVVVSACSASSQFNAGGVCSPNPCPQGACCHPDGTCVLTSSLASCSGLTNFVFGNFGSTCTTFVCPASGACCEENLCTLRFSYQCPTPAVFTASAACGPVVCPPLGACCRHEECLPLVETECTGNHHWAGAGTACGPRNDCCRADFNLSQALTVLDIFDFLAAWFAGNSLADFNGTGGIGVADIFDFLAAWFAGC